MSILNNKSKYGLFSKLLHWLTAAGLIVQIPLGFYLVDLEFDQSRVCLLYTSPSPRDRTRSRMPSSA